MFREEVFARIVWGFCYGGEVSRGIRDCRVLFIDLVGVVFVNIMKLFYLGVGLGWESNVFLCEFFSVFFVGLSCLLIAK